MPEEETQSDNAEANTEEKQVEYVTMEEHKNLQRKLSAKDKSEKEVRKQLAEFTTRVMSDNTRNDKTMSDLVEAMSSNDLLDMTKAKAVLAQAATSKQSSDYVAKAMGRLAEQLNGEDFNSEEKFSSAREMWQGGRVEEAIAEVTRINNPTENQAEALDVEELTRTIKAGIMKDLGRVPTGSSTVTTTKETKSLDELTGTNTSKMNLAQLKEHKAAIWDAADVAQGIKHKR